MLFFYKSEMKDKQMKKQNKKNFKLNANTEGISMTYISGHPLKCPT